MYFWNEDRASCGHKNRAPNPFDWRSYVTPDQQEAVIQPGNYREQGSRGRRAYLPSPSLSRVALACGRRCLLYGGISKDGRTGLNGPVPPRSRTHNGGFLGPVKWQERNAPIDSTLPCIKTNIVRSRRVLARFVDCKKKVKLALTGGHCIARPSQATRPTHRHAGHPPKIHSLLRLVATYLLGSRFSVCNKPSTNQQALGRDEAELQKHPIYILLPNLIWVGGVIVGNLLEQTEEGNI